MLYLSMAVYCVVTFQVSLLSVNLVQTVELKRPLFCSGSSGPPYFLSDGPAIIR